ncbi:MAG: DUF177 domain-containing protein [Bacteroidaceae bacterium]|nr:DUF177 domain-containing protein [Bacteroidaceae bacterium]
MGRLSAYNVELKGLKEKQASYQWTAGDEFFAIVEGEEVQKGKVNVDLTVTKASGSYVLSFSLNGFVIVTCDRCLDDMTLDIDTTGELKVRLGADFGEEGDVIIVPESDGSVNVAWYIYEFIALAIPIKHVHAPGKCNKGMMEKLDEYSSPDDPDAAADGNQAGDSRWDELKNMNFENDND